MICKGSRLQQSKEENQLVQALHLNYIPVPKDKIF